jgi:hypothetical protein
MIACSYRERQVTGSRSNLLHFIRKKTLEPGRQIRPDRIGSVCAGE